MATLQIRNFPDDLKERLRARSEQAALTMSDYVIALVRRNLDEPTMDEWLARVSDQPEHPELNLTAAKALSEARAERDRG